MGFFIWIFMLRIKLNKASPDCKKIIATIGNFDGLHRGHWQLIKKLNEVAKAENARSMVITFDTLPHEYFADQSGTIRTPRISLLRDKVMILAESKLVDEVVVLHFNASMAKLSPDEFIKNYLEEKLKIDQMIVGHDFRFGAKAQGTIADLIRHGIVTDEFIEVRHKEIRVSSSLIRELASEQQLGLIYDYLGRNIRYTSRIVRGNQLARKFGMPTINLNLCKIRPILWGIYVSYVYIDGVRYNGVTNIGKNPTVSEGKVYKIETHLLDVNTDLYGKIATVEILEYLRPELKFDDLDTLFKQMYKDMDDARDFFVRAN